MGKYILTEKALSDLSDIWNYTIKKWSEAQADKYRFMLIDSCNTLANDPELGKVYDEIYDNLKGFRAGRHVIFYKKHETNLILIIRILHSQMDVKK
jgi:toxin ParE1/3/4